jgi:surface protein
MFALAVSFNKSLANFDTRKVTSMFGMFSLAPVFNNNISSFDTINVTSMGSMFSGATSFNQPLGHFNTSNVTSMQSMFNGATGMSDTNYETLKNWNVSKVDIFSGMFSVKMSNVVMSNILAGWATNGTGVKPNLRLGVNLAQRAIGTTSDIQTYYTSKNWTFFAGATQIPIATFFSATS